MKRVRNNLFNKIFRPKALKEYQEWEKTAKTIVGWYNQLNLELKKATSLQDLIEIHKHAWQVGYNNPNIAPCPWGMFRCNSIPELTLDTLYLGDIYGLWTNTGKFWEDHKYEEYGSNGFGIDENVLIYSLIMQQYRKLLKSNFTSIKDEVAKYLFCK